MSLRLLLFVAIFIFVGCQKEGDMTKPPVDPPVDTLLDALNTTWKGDYNGTVYQHHFTPGWGDAYATNNSTFHVISFDTTPVDHEMIRFNYQIDSQPSSYRDGNRSLFQDSIIFLELQTTDCYGTFTLDSTTMHINWTTTCDFTPLGGSFHEYIGNYQR